MLLIATSQLGVFAANWLVTTHRAPRVLRNADGTPAVFELPGGVTVDIDLADAFQEGRFLADRTSAPDGFPTADPILTLRMWATAAHARGLGRMAGSYQEGVLFTN